MTDQNLSNHEHRQFERLPFVRNIALFSGSNAWTCEMIDISLKGILFTKPEDWLGKAKDVFRLSISLAHSPSISMSIEIANVDDKTIGAKWKKIDVDSFISLKRILELNATDKYRLTKEMSFLES